MRYQTPEHEVFDGIRPDFISAFVNAFKNLSSIPFLAYPERHYLTPQQRADFEQQALNIQHWSPTFIHTRTNLPFVAERKSDGDTCIVAGTVASSGTKIGKTTVRLSFDGTRFWRSPNRVNNDPDESFSRDQLMGVLAYAASEYEFFDNYVVPYFRHILENGCKMCNDSKDGRCTLRITTKAIAYSVFKYYGRQDMLPSSWAYLGWINNLTQYFSAAVNKIGYRLNLIALGIYITSFLQKKKPTKMQLATLQILVDRQPENPFVRFLLEGTSPTTLEKTFKYLPTTEPNGNHSVWTLSVDTNSPDEWVDSMGWEWVFLLRLFIMDKRN